MNRHVDVSGDLQDTLTQLLRSGSTSNPALNRLLDDYGRYHLVLVVVGGAMVLCLLLMAAACWRRSRSAPRTADRRSPSERRILAGLGALALVVGALLAVIVAANLSNALDPRHGFAGSVATLGTPSPGTASDALHRSFTTWLQSGTAEVPPLVQRSIDDRLAWQRPKAVVSAVLLSMFVVLGVRLWAELVRRARRSHRRGASDRLLLLAGWGSVAVCLLLMVMVIGNTQGSIAPLALTLFYG